MNCSVKGLQTLTLPDDFTVTAHAGAFDTPENTVASVEKIVSENCDIIEMDVSFRPDGTPVIIHADAPGADEGDLLETVFKLIAAHPSMRMNLDLKSVKNLPAVDALARQYGLTDRAFYTGVGESWAQTVREHSVIPFYLNLHPTFGEKRSPAAAERLAQKLKDSGAIGLNAHFSDVSPTLVRAIRACGMPVSLWTANSKAAMLRCLYLGADNITTRHPDRLRPLAALAGKRV